MSESSSSSWPDPDGEDSPLNLDFIYLATRMDTIINKLTRIEETAEDIKKSIKELQKVSEAQPAVGSDTQCE
ncbi:hypothetical protein Y032_0276g1097 [Ancylostoma ceylanicum]|uniref:Uncharacterized protein n=1 Tax=Ancylostoma ceylanicum TaxID=53326 RepID=A0A016S845_9BILA|nr:hypothetical protein Y032_0276g1097 [Ancylostoma ceylanicum]